MSEKVDIKNFILASNSQRRREMLRDRGYNFQVMASDTENDIVGKDYERELLVDCAKAKALSVAKNVYGHDIIVSADTIVVLDNKIIGKPKDTNDAFEILSKLSGSTHFVETCVFILKLNNEITDGAKKHTFTNYLYDVDRTYVTFRDLTYNDIDTYIKEFNPLDKAGAYGIQDNNFDFVAKIEGNRDNVIGFPMNLFERLLREIM